MKVTIHIKSESGWQPTSYYEFNEEEFNRLKSDFESYSRTGQPRIGVYMRDSIHPDRTNSVILNFEYIAIIEESD
jgi:hypothetical protein